MATLYGAVGLAMKVAKHLHVDNNKAAMYFAARSLRFGRPTEGSAEYDELQQLKAAGYKFKQSPDGQDVVAIRPDGKVYSGKDCLEAWDRLTS